MSVWRAVVPGPRAGRAGCKHHFQAGVTPALTVLTLLGKMSFMQVILHRAMLGRGCGGWRLPWKTSLASGLGGPPPPSKEHECRREYGLSAHECWVCMHTYTHRLAKMCGQALMAWSISRTSRLQTKTPAQPCSPPAPPCYSKALLQFPDSVLPCSQAYMVLSAPIQ